MRIKIKKYGMFEAVKTNKVGIENCKMCWFGQQHPEPTHCPEGIPCHKLVFVKIGDK